MKLGQGQCKIVCVLGKRWLLLGKNQDMEILIEKEYLYASSKGMPLFHVPRHRKHLLSVPPFYHPSPRKWQVLRLLFSADLFIIDKTHYNCSPFSDKR